MTDPATKLVDDLLAESAAVDPNVPDDLMAAVMRDALDMQPTAVAREVPQGLWAMVLDLVGGWPAVSGLAAAGVAGLWLGIAPPAALESVAADVLGDVQAVDLLGGDMLTSFSIDGDI